MKRSGRVCYELILVVFFGVVQVFVVEGFLLGAIVLLVSVE
jgi:hypothetical protein